MKKCTAWLGHRFEARYSYGAPAKNLDLKHLSVYAALEVIELSKTKTYVHDICVHCGFVITYKQTHDSVPSARTQTYRAYCYLRDKLSIKVIHKNAFRISDTTGLMLDDQYLMYAEGNGTKLTKYEPHQFPGLFKFLGVDYEEFLNAAN